MIARHRFLILAEGALGVHTSKTAAVILRYRPEQVAAVIDASQAGRSAAEVLGFGGDIPVVATLEEGLAFGPDALLVGTHPAGGQLSDSQRALLRSALRAGLHLYSGMHSFLKDDPVLAREAEARDVELVDLRAVPGDLGTPTGARERVGVPVVLTVGSDCNVGKMTTSWEICARAGRTGLRYAFVATGQTGVLLSDAGMAVDRVISDFVAGAAERLVCESAPNAHLVMVEGQGSLVHPAFSGVSLGLLHGSQPDAMILCSVAGREEMRHCPGRPLRPLTDLVALHEEAAGWVRPARVIGVSLATHLLQEDGARAALAAAEAETQLPCEDPVRFPSGALFEACEALRS